VAPGGGGPQAPAVTVVVIDASDPALLAVRDLCYETLHRPFGVARNDAWNEGDPASTHFGAFAGDRLVGYTRLILEGGGAHVRQVVVDPAYRRLGVASALLRAVLARARETGAPFAFLNAREKAVGLYERAGFRVTGAPFRMGRTYLAHVRMELPLR